MSETSTSLAMLPAKVERSVTPPPKKAEVLEALAQIKLKQLAKEKEEATERHNVLEAEIKDEMRELVRKNIDFLLPQSHVNTGSRNHNGGELTNLEVDFAIPESRLPASLRKKLNEYHDLYRKVYWGLPTLSEVRKQVRETMSNTASTSQRIQQMLDDPAVSKALEKMLTHAEDSRANTAAITV